MYEITDEEIGLLREAIPVLYKIKINNLEKAVEEAGDVGTNYRRFRKLKKSLGKVYKDYKELLEGLDYLAINSNPFDRKVNSLLKKFKDTRLYFEFANGDGSEGGRSYETKSQ
jgi:hypothetical protein